MSTQKYMLDANGEPVKAGDLIEWAKWFESDANRIVAVEYVGPSRVSTVFLGLDHQFGSGEPILWETMVFGGGLDQEQDRCSGSRADALAMHKNMVERVSKLELRALLDKA